MGFSYVFEGAEQDFFGPTSGKRMAANICLRSIQPAGSMAHMETIFLAEK